MLCSILALLSQHGCLCQNALLMTSTFCINTKHLKRPIETTCLSGTDAGQTRDNSLTRLFALVLPFTAGALSNALEGLCSQPGIPALALIGLALLQPSVLSFGKLQLCAQLRPVPALYIACVDSKVTDLRMLSFSLAQTTVTVFTSLGLQTIPRDVYRGISCL